MSGVTYDQMKQRQSMPLEAKVAFTVSRIRTWYEHFDGDVYVSYSGGKDSTVLLDIVKRMYPDVPAVFCDTGLEYPEVRELALKNADVVLKPQMTFKQVIEKHGYPFPSKEQALYVYQYKHSKSEKLRNYRWNGWPPNGSFAIAKKWRFLIDAPFEVSNKCCDVMKKSPFHKFERERAISVHRHDGRRVEAAATGVPATWLQLVRCEKAEVNTYGFLDGTGRSRIPAQ